MDGWMDGWDQVNQWTSRITGHPLWKMDRARVLQHLGVLRGVGSWQPGPHPLAGLGADHGEGRREGLGPWRPVEADQVLRQRWAYFVGFVDRLRSPESSRMPLVTSSFLLLVVMPEPLVASC